MSIKDWKDKELNGLLNERWGFSMNLNKLNEGKDKKPDEDGDGVPDYADKNPGKDDHAEKDSDDKPKKKAKKDGIPQGLKDYQDKQKGKKEVNEEDMGDNPEGVTELMDAINGLSEKESEQVYKMLLKKHGKEDKKDSPMDMKERKLREAIRKIIKTKFRKK